MFPDRSICRAAEVVYPSTEAELISIVANATLLKRKMKVATSTSHSIPKLVCPDGENGLIISTENLDQAINVDQSSMTMTVGSGMTLRELISKAAEAGLALPYGPYWWGLTVGGLLGTGAHGSSLWGLGSAVHDYVVQLRIITPAGSDEGYAKVRILEIDDPELNAAKVSLGVLGVISQVRIDTTANLPSIFIYFFLSSFAFSEQPSRPEHAPTTHSPPTLGRRERTPNPTPAPPKEEREREREPTISPPEIWLHFR